VCVLGHPYFGRTDRLAPYWALRHYRRDNFENDPSSPFIKGASASEFDSEAVGVAAYASADGTTIVVHYVSKSPRAEQVARRLFPYPDDGARATLTRASGDAIEVRFAAKDGERLGLFFFCLMGALGRAIYL
jgi:hypothetical protein